MAVILFYPHFSGSHKTHQATHHEVREQGHGGIGATGNRGALLLAAAVAAFAAFLRAYFSASSRLTHETPSIAISAPAGQAPRPSAYRAGRRMSRQS